MVPLISNSRAISQCSASIIITVTSWWDFNCLFSAVSWLRYFASLLLLLPVPPLEFWSFLCWSYFLQSLNSTVIKTEPQFRTKVNAQETRLPHSNILHWEQLPWIKFRFVVWWVSFFWCIHPIWFVISVLFWISYRRIGFSIFCLHQRTPLACSLRQDLHKNIASFLGIAQIT